MFHYLITFLRPQPVLMRPMFGSFGKAVGRGLGQSEARATHFFIVQGIVGNLANLALYMYMYYLHITIIGDPVPFFQEDTLNYSRKLQKMRMAGVTRIYLHELRLQGCCAGELRLHLLVNIVNI